jgi:PAS domain S-box-containing protein
MFDQSNVHLIRGFVLLLTGAITGLVALQIRRNVSKAVQSMEAVARMSEDIKKSNDDLQKQNAALAAEIAERNRAKEELKQAEEKYRNIFHNSTEGLFQATPEGGFLAANDTLARTFGYDSPEELMEEVKDITTCLHVDCQRGEEFKKMMAAEDSVHDFEFQAYKKDGSIIEASLNSHIIRDGNDHIFHFEGALKDVTEKKRMAELKTKKQPKRQLSQKRFSGQYEP